MSAREELLERLLEHYLDEARLRCFCFRPNEGGHSSTCEVTKAMDRWAEQVVADVLRAEKV